MQNDNILGIKQGKLSKELLEWSWFNWKIWHVLQVELCELLADKLFVILEGDSVA